METVKNSNAGVVIKLNRFGQETTVSVEKTHYVDGNLALVLKTVPNEELYAVVSVNFPNEDIPYGYVAVKDYSENDGLLKILIANGVLDPNPIRVLHSGFVKLPVHKVLI